MKTNRRLSLAILVSTLAATALMTGCSTTQPQPQVRHDQDPTVDMKSYRSFAFFDPLSTDCPQFSSLLSARLKQATRTQLEQRNYVYDERNPELAIDFRVDLSSTPEYRATSAGGAWRMRGGSATIDTSYNLDGALHIAVVDLRRQAIVWHGVVANRLGEDAMKNPGPVVEQAVQQILAGVAAR